MTREGGEKKKQDNMQQFYQDKITKMYANFLDESLLFQTYGKLRVSACFERSCTAT